MSKNHPAPNDSNRAAAFQITEASVSRLFEIQEKQLEVRTRELALEERNQDNYLTYSKDLLSRQADDLKDQRAHSRRMALIRNGSIGILIIALLFFAGWAITMGKEQVAMEVLKYAGTALLSGLAGYGIRGAQGNKSEEPDGSNNQK